ncbi:hypothetical protein [Dactylosporangium matsuzakiense]|uniref:hypothetical protein n=1 Tax=Dactylosporangium matsuzakiense TaxID=53360 RepID=UPI0021C2E271|nr:hypothetical protein [Dactylosporangium matsuzakiense]UWZ48510.1 hypothetical protein Dmats_20145 [Dactylosporangium matsuzakiense]
MLALIWGAIVARRVVSTGMFLLAALVSTGLSLAPWYAARATDAAADARIAAAPQSERTVSATGTVSLDLAGETVVQTFAASAGRALALPVAGQAVGVEVAATLTAGDRQLALPLRYREALCANAVVDGSCPQATGDVVLSAPSAERLGVRVGDRLDVTTGPAAPRRPLRLAGIYRPADPLSWYWSGADAAWTTFDTVAASATTVRATFDALLGPSVFTSGGELTAGVERMRRVPLQVDTAGAALADRIAADRQVVARGVLLAAAQLAVIGWLAMAVAARYAAEARRSDAAQLALRGARRWRLLAATGGQTGVPLAAGALAGALIGVLADGPARLPIAGGVLAAALLSAVLADWRTTGLPVERLLHAAAPRPPRLGTAVVEVCVLGLAGASIYQSLAAHSAIGVQLLAPGTLAASAAILVGRLLVPAATAAGRSALVNGRVAAGFGALLLARRSSAYRMLPLLTAAGCLLAVAAQHWAEAGQARHDRSAVEVGGQRVLTVAPGDRAHLLNAVRAADPGGHQAMAVVAGLGPGGEPVLAVDSPRLPYVLAGPAPLDPRRLRPAAPPPITFAGTGLTLTADVPAVSDDLPDAGAAPPTGPPVLLATLVVTATGAPLTARFTPLDGRTGTADASVPGCRSGCRLVTFELAGGRAVELQRLDADGRAVITPDVFADPGRWRTGAGNVAATVSMRSYDGRLALAAVTPGLSKLPVDGRLYVVDAPVPLPAAVAGRPPAADQRGTGAIDLFGGRAVPVEPIAAPLLPGVGTHGVLVDLEYADRIAGGAPRAERQQVWLAPGAPADVTDRLRAAGLTVVGEDSVTAADARQARFGPAAADRYGLLMGGLALLAAAIALLVIAAVQRRARGEEFVALRRQGVPAAALHAAGRWAALVPILLAALTAGLAAAVARAIAHPPIPVFTDAWPAPAGNPGVAAIALLATTAAAAALFAGCALAPQYRTGGWPWRR